MQKLLLLLLRSPWQDTPGKQFQDSFKLMEPVRVLPLPWEGPLIEPI